MKPIIPFGLGLMFFARFVSKKFINFIIFDYLKDSPAGGFFFRFEHFWLKTSAEISPPKPKILATSLGEGQPTLTLPSRVSVEAAGRNS